MCNKLIVNSAIPVGAVKHYTHKGDTLLGNSSVCISHLCTRQNSLCL